MPRPVRVVSGLALLACAACTSATEPGATESDATALSGTTALSAATLFASLSRSPEALISAPPGAAAPAGLSCPRGGSYRVTVESSGVPRRGTATYRGCGVADASGQVWTFTSVPSLAVEFGPIPSDSTLATVGSISGAVRVESAGVRGTCRIDSRMRVDTRLSPPFASRVRQTGEVCGRVIDTTWTTAGN